MTAIPAPTQRIESTATPGFRTTLVSEWTKLRSVRSTWIMTGLAIVLSIGFSAAIALVMGLTFDNWSDTDRAMFDPVMSSMSGLLFSLILLIVLGVTIVTSEYSSGMIRTTFIVNPQRTKVFAAKAVIIGALGVVIHAIAVPGMFFTGQAMFAAYGLETTSIGDNDATRFVIVLVCVSSLTFTLIPLSIACLLRGTASAITASIGFFILPSMLSPLLPVWVQQNVLRYLPDIATDSLSGYTPPGAAMYLNQTPALIVVALWLAGALVVAAIVLNRRDV
jgi:ABC-2 type transport system permease protein